MSTTTKKRKNNRAVIRHPGEILLVDFMTPCGYSVTELADAMGYTSSGLRALLKERIQVSRRMALALDRAIGMPALFWMEMQFNYQQEQYRRTGFEADWVEKTTDTRRKFRSYRRKKSKK